VSNRVPGPFYVCDFNDKWALVSVGITLFTNLGFFQEGVWSSPYLLLNILNFLLILSLPACVVLFLYGYFSTRRVEFYSDFVRLYSRDKKAIIDAKYSDLYFEWKPRRIRRARYILTLKYGSGSVDQQQSWQVHNVKGYGGGMSLFKWLKARQLILPSNAI